MSTMEDVEAAEARMNAAKDALLKYVERRKQLDGDEYRRLVAHLKKAQTAFFDAISQLND